MTDQKWVDFDYQRYLDGDEVFYRSGDKFEGEIFLSKKRDKYILISVPIQTSGDDNTILSHRKNGKIFGDNLNGYDLVMKPKTTKLWVAVKKGHDSPKIVSCSNAHINLSDLKKNYSSDIYHYISIEVEG